jgi:PAS domain S-box-containing protein
VIRLAHRGILIVIIPLVFQLLFVAALLPLLWQTQREVVRRWQAREKLILSYQASWDTLCSVGVMVHYGAYQQEMTFDQLGQNLDAARREMNMAFEQIELDPAERAECAILRKQAGELFAACRREVAAMRKEGLAAQPELQRRLRQATPPLIDRLDSLSRLHQPVTQANASELRATLIAFFAAAVLVSVAVALLLGYWYASSIRRPLNAISENSVRLSLGEPLLPVLQGADELAALDRLFHSVADAVNAASNHERAVIDNAAELICSIDQHGVFTAANRFSEEMLGLPPEQLIGRSLFEFLHSDDADLADAKLQHACQSVDSETFEVRLCKPGSQVIDSRWTCFWSRSRKGLFCVAADVTEEKNIQRLKEDFVNMISHDLRSPLMSMHGSLTLISEHMREGLAPPVVQEVAAAARNVEKLIAFVNDLLDFQRLQDGKVPLEHQICDVREIVAEAAEMLKSLSTDRNVAISLPAANWQVLCDRQKLLQTVMNLLSNAIKFSPAGGIIAVRVEETPEWTEISVTDQGPGVPIEMQQRIFDAFEQVASPKAKEGTGLGLAICRLIVEAHGGQIGVRGRHDDEPGGAVFWFKLPKQPAGSQINANLRQVGH